MQRISRSKLADMLNEGFQGDVQFSGTVRGIIYDSKGEYQYAFYEANGRFTLHRSEDECPSNRDSFVLINRGKGCGSRFTFNLKPGEKAESYSHDRFSEGIIIPITNPQYARLQIDHPEDVFF